MVFTIVFHCKQGKSQYMFHNDLEEQSDLLGLICLLFQLSLSVRKPAFCICENKDADQLCVHAKLISAFVFATWIVQYLLFLNTNFKPLAIFCDYTARFVSDLVRNPEDRFSHNEAQLQFYRALLYSRIC